jgi:hypothetical protein
LHDELGNRPITECAPRAGVEDLVIVPLVVIALAISKPRAKREAWRARVRQQWIWFRRNISYQAFEHALHHAFEAGMAWVFRKWKAYAQWRIAGHRFRVALVARILWHGDSATRHPHCLGEIVTGVDATAAPLRNLNR